MLSNLGTLLFWSPSESAILFPSSCGPMPICTLTSSRSLCRSWRPSAPPLLTTMTLIRCHGPFCDVTMSKKPQKVSISRCFPGLSNYSSIINRATIFLHIQQVLFAAGDVKVMSFFRNSSFFSRRHVLFSRIPLFELDSRKLLSGCNRYSFPVWRSVFSAPSIVCF